MDYKVSVVVPIFNIFPYLEDCINSILEQTYDNIEIVLVDDGSTDDSGRLCEEYSEKYENIIVVHQVNAGLGMARNTGIRNAKGDYICFVDGDDYISKDHVSNLMSRIIQEGTDACYGGYQQQKGEVFIEQKNPLSGLYLDKQRILHEFIPRMCGKLDYHCVDEVPMSVCMSIYSMQILKDNCLLFNSERKLISEDFVFNLDFLEHSNSISVSESCGYFYRNNEGSLTKKYLGDRLMKQIDFTKYIIARTKKLGVYEESYQRIYSTFLSWVRNIVKSEQSNYQVVGIKTSINKIKETCLNEFVIESLEIYDEKYLTRMPAFLNFLIRKRLCSIIWIMSYIKSKIEHQ